LDFFKFVHVHIEYQCPSHNLLHWN
jgi:hypothetical protein